MEPKTRVKRMNVKPQREWPNHKHDVTQPIEIPPIKKGWALWSWRCDELIRNFAVVGALLLTIVAIRNSSSPEAISVFSALKEGAGMEWDESVGKLSFVNQLLPQELQAVWNEKSTPELYVPINGNVVHAWAESEPYVSIRPATDDVRAAADGEVMSIAHGIGEERIVRVRHTDDSEALYGNLDLCYAQVGDAVRAGDVIAKVMDGRDLVFEWREDGRAVDPSKQWKPFGE